ncbi:MAG TPA: hypothetical protein VKA92_07635, partial [Segetibacter sp.]|nr:hypothetical protein [Segetibacter sp.]
IYPVFVNLFKQKNSRKIKTLNSLQIVIFNFKNCRRVAFRLFECYGSPGKQLSFCSTATKNNGSSASV